MATNTALVKKWIQYLKNNQIVKLQSDPKTGNLTYNREVTSNDIETFLDGSSDYTPDEISNAIHTVMTGNAISKQPKSLAAPNQQPSSALTVQQKQQPQPQQKQLPGNAQQQISGPAAVPKPVKKKKFDTGNATDIDYRDINEQFKDDAGFTFDEADVEKIFNMLSSVSRDDTDDTDDTNTQSRPGNKPASRAAPAPKEAPPEHSIEQKQENIRKIKRVIRDTMTEGQRMALWRLLNDA